MDLVASARLIIVAMQHTNPKGESKLLPACTLPLTGVKCVKKVVTDLAVLDIVPEGFLLRERAPGVSVEEIRAKTAGRLVVPDEVPPLATVMLAVAGVREKSGAVAEVTSIETAPREPALLESPK